ncbi:MAG: chemotaxis protein CheX [bacterium]
MNVRDSILKAIDDVLDKMVFLFFEEEESESGGPKDFFYITQVEVSGVITGTLNIFLSEGTANLVARNLLGIRDEDELFDGTIDDALEEFTNLIGGRMMTILHPPGPFNMEIPHRVDEPAHPATDQSELAISGTLEDEPFRIRLAYRETPT